MVTAGMLPRAAVREVEARLRAAGCPDADFDAAELFRLAAGGDVRLADAPLGAEQAERLEALTARRAAREPLQYLCGSWPFLDFELAVGPGVLCPRADTEVVAEAAAKQCEMIVSHHPVIFSPLKKLTPRDVPFQLVQKGISAICMHTNLDAAEGGVNEVLAGIFGMRDWEVFADGCGRVGEVEPITVPELAHKAQAVLGGRCNRPRSGPAVQVKFADTGRTVKRLAVISGAGGSMFEDALAVGADCLLTGEANHHAAIDAVRLGLSLVAAGHYATEFPVCAAIADRLRTALPELEVRVSGENRDPFTYI